MSLTGDVFYCATKIELTYSETEQRAIRAINIDCRMSAHVTEVLNGAKLSPRWIDSKYQGSIFFQGFEYTPWWDAGSGDICVGG